MKMHFHKIEIHNFMSFADDIFDFDSNRGMNLVTGKNFDIPNSKNGSGKSTVFSALLFGLYGQLPNKIKAEHIANRYIDDKEVRVVVYLDVDEKQYKVASGMNKRAQGVFQLCTFENNEEIDITKSSIAETRKFFEEQVLHCDISLFLRTILLTSEQNYNFFNLKKQDKREFIEKLFDISVFGDMYSKIHRDVLDIDKEILSYQNQLLVLTRNRDDYSKRIQEFDIKKEQQKQQLQEQHKQLDQQLSQMQNITVERNNDLISKYEQAYGKLVQAKQKTDDKLTELQKNILHIQTELKLLINLKDEKTHSLEIHSELIERLCDDCKTVFLEYHSLSNCQKDIDDALTQINIKKDALKSEQKHLIDIQNKEDLIQTKIRSAEQKISELNMQFNSIKSKQDKLIRDIELVDFNIKQIDQKTNPYVPLFESVVQQIEDGQNRLVEQTKKAKCLKKAEEIVSQDSLKKFIIKDLIGLINNRIKMYLMKMGAKYTCEFNEDLDYQFTTDSGSCELFNFSCGEKKRLEIATCLSFRDFISQRSNIQSNVLILDEYIDSGIDTLAVDSILSILKKFTIESKQNIFIISHRTEVSNELFDNIIEIQKKNGISTITYV